MQLNFKESSHTRYNPLIGEWILVSPHRTKRPWQGKTEQTSQETRPPYDEKCYLCPGNTRAVGVQNPDYKNTFAFNNDFGALLESGTSDVYEDGLLYAKGEQGICRVICFSPDHSLTLAEMSVDDIKKVVDLWQAEYLDLGAKPFINHVQIFENKGAIMGCSNPHPHGQIWAQSSIPQEVIKKSKQQEIYWNKNNRSLLQDYLIQEIEADERIVCQNDLFVALIPFWAVWPYEAMIVPRRHISNIAQMTVSEKELFAEIIKNLTQRYDRLFNTSFPYSSGIHQSPTDNLDHTEWHFHMSFYPPLLRSANVKKFMVGYEMFGSPQRDITAEMAAKQLREL